MENNQEKETFSYTYSAKQKEEIHMIRKKYMPPEEDKMGQLRRLDASVTKKATSVSIVMGVIGTLILGTGMSLTMTNLNEIFDFSHEIAMVLGIIIGIIGIVFVSLAYPLYNRTIAKEREKIAPEILRLTDELLKM